jgi:hypothetical protein
MPYKNTIRGKEVANILFEHVWVHFGIPRRIILEMDSIFISSFLYFIWDNMDMKLKRYTTFHS